MRRALAIDEKSRGVNHPNVGRGLNNLAQLLQRANRLSEAEPLMRRALAINEKSLGADHPTVAGNLNNLAGLLQFTNRLAEAEPLMWRVLAISEKSLGADHPNLATALSNLATLLMDTSRFTEAEPLLRRALAIDEKSFGPNHPKVAIRLGNLASLLMDTNRLAEAEPFHRRALAINEKSLGPDHPSVALTLNNLARLLQNINRLAEAEPLMRRALAINEKSLGPDHPSVATTLNNLANLLQNTNRLAEAEPLMWSVLAMSEKSLGADHPKVATALSNLATLLINTSRFTKAEPLLRRALAIDEKSFGPNHPNVAIRLGNLASLLMSTTRLTEAQPLMRRALAIDEKSFGPAHPNVAVRLNNLGQLLQATNQLAEAEPLMRRALAIDEMSFGHGHPAIARDLNNLAQLLQGADRTLEAEPLMRRALALVEKSLGTDHSKVAIALNNLALLMAGRGNWGDAVVLGRRAKPLMIGRGNADDGDRLGLGSALLTRNSVDFRAHARATFRVGADSPASRDEGFELAQWAQQTGAADALVQMSARFAMGGGPLATLVRERQDLIARRQGEDKRLLAAVGRAEARAAGESRASIAGLDAKLDGIDKRLANEFKGYASLASPKPLTIAASQALLSENEALVLFLDVPRIGRLPEESLVWVITKADARWARIELGTRGLRDQVQALRCGLDSGAWTSDRCFDLLKVAYTPADRDAGRPLPFDLKLAQRLYSALFGQIEELIIGKHLLVVPSGPLTMLPFHALATTAPTEDANYSQAAWLGTRQPITILPSVASLEALRKIAKPSQAGRPFIGFGNPLLDGDPTKSSHSARARLARELQRCPERRTPMAAVADSQPDLKSVARSGLADLDRIRSQLPLPETADELCAVAQSLGVPASEIQLGAQATELQVKTMSADGRLAGYRILHFATHGAVAGELQRGAEPGLILTPPDKATEIDDGYLTASEIAGLKLDADWVILSACNTAAGGGDGAEALSGLARAFFYAGARALLVSHWAVESDAAVKLITKALSTMAADANIGRAEALRRSMLALIETGTLHEAHPSQWAPFVVVGEGAR